MKSKFLFAIFSAAALTVAAPGVALGAANSGCIYSKGINSIQSGIIGDAPTDSSNSINFNSPSGIAGVGLAVLGLVAGGLFWKAQRGQSGDSAGNAPKAPTGNPASEADLPTESPTESLIDAAAYKAASVFPIEVPAEALTVQADATESSAIASSGSSIR